MTTVAELEADVESMRGQVDALRHMLPVSVDAARRGREMLARARGELERLERTLAEAKA